MSKRSMWFALGILGVSYAGLAISACSGDDTSVGPAADASTADTSVADSTTGDSTTPDSSHDSAADTSNTDSASSCPGATDAALDDAAVAAGMALVLQYKCYGCHQSAPIDAGLILSGRMTSITDAGNVYPANLTPDRTTGIGCWTDQQISEAILHAKDQDGGKLCLMPAWATKVGLDGGSAAEIVAFLRSLPPAVNAIPDTTTCPPPAEAGAPDGGDAGDAGDAGGD